MTSTINGNAVKYTEDKTTFLEELAERWLEDHREAEECVVWESLARDVNRLFVDVFALDRELQENYCEGVPYQQELEGRIHNLVVRWVSLAGRLVMRAIEFEGKGFVVIGLDELRKNIVEAKAVVNPSQELPAALATLRDKALTEHREGKSLAGFAG